MTAQSLKNRLQRQSLQLLSLQLAGVLGLSLLMMLIKSMQAGLSVMAGGVAYCLPQLIFALSIFQYTGARQTTQFVAAFFIGELLKLMLSAISFLLIVKYLPVSLLSVAIGFVGAIIAFWIACMWQFGVPQRCAL